MINIKQQIISYKPEATKKTIVLYWIAISLFSLLFLASAIWTIIDPKGAFEDTEHLGYPAFTCYPLAIAKILGVIAIVSNHSRTLKAFAYAGFMYDLILAIMAHYYLMEPASRMGIALFGAALWIFAFVMDKKVKE
jgi:hypothetical protein